MTYLLCYRTYLWRLSNAIPWILDIPEFISIFHFDSAGCNFEQILIDQLHGFLDHKHSLRNGNAISDLYLPAQPQTPDHQSPRLYFSRLRRLPDV